MTVANAKLPGGTKSFTSGSRVPTIDSNGLFPFLDGYGVYAGTCRANNPSFWDPTYFTTSGKGSVVLDPGDFLEPTGVQMGTLLLRVRNSSNGPVNARVTLTQVDPNCTQPASDLSPGVGADGDQSFDVPFGTYRVCASATISGQTRRRVSVAPAGTGTPTAPRDVVVAPGANGISRSIDVQLPGSGSGSQC
jgi:hypothetical protein